VIDRQSITMGNMRKASTGPEIFWSRNYPVQSKRASCITTSTLLVS